MLNSFQEPVKQRFTIPALRWVIAVLLLLISVLNYIDRQTLSILARTIQTDLGINDAGYAQVVLAFQLTYAVMYLLSGRILDVIGTRFGQFFFIIWWSVANAFTGFSSGRHFQKAASCFAFTTFDFASDFMMISSVTPLLIFVGEMPII